jgi:hypothetical protein
MAKRRVRHVWWDLVGHFPALHGYGTFVLVPRPGKARFRRTPTVRKSWLGS